MFSRYAHRFVENREWLSNLATTRYIPDAGLHPSTRSEPVEEPIFDEPQVLASDHSPAGQLRRSTALDPVEILLGMITFATALGEGATNDWLALMLVDNRGAPPDVGALSVPCWVVRAPKEIIWVTADYGATTPLPYWLLFFAFIFR